TGRAPPSPPHGRQAVLRGQSDRLVEGAYRRRVDVFHPGEVGDGDAGVYGHTQEVRAFLDTFAADDLGSDQAQGVWFSQQLDANLPCAGKVAGARDALRDAHHEGDAERCGQRLTEGDAPDHPLPRGHAPGHVDGVVGAVAAGRVGPGYLALRVRVTAAH